MMATRSEQYTSSPKREAKTISVDAMDCGNGLEDILDVGILLADARGQDGEYQRSACKVGTRPAYLFELSLSSQLKHVV
jgi:hypothetical protein